MAVQPSNQARRQARESCVRPPQRVSTPIHGLTHQDPASKAVPATDGGTTAKSPARKPVQSPTSGIRSRECVGQEVRRCRRSRTCDTSGFSDVEDTGPADHREPANLPGSISATEWHHHAGDLCPDGLAGHYPQLRHTAFAAHRARSGNREPRFLVTDRVWNP